MNEVGWSIEENTEMIHAAFAEIINLIDSGLADDSFTVLEDLKGHVLYVGHTLPFGEAKKFVDSFNQTMANTVEMYNRDQAALRIILADRIGKNAMYEGLSDLARCKVRDYQPGRTWEVIKPEEKPTFWSIIRSFFKR